MRRAFLAASCALAGLLLQACNEKFDVEMEPKDDGLERTIKVYKLEGASTSTPPKTVDADGKTLEKVRELYKQKGEADKDGKKVFRTFLKDSHVNLDGGTARYVRLASDLGAASYYSESFDDSDDLAGDLDAQLERANQIADMLHEWFEMELANEPRAKTLLEWIDRDFRRDFKNLIVYVKLVSKQRSLDWIFARCTV